MQRNTMRTPGIIVCFILLTTCTFTQALAQWNWDPAVNNPICTASSNQGDPLICSDGSGGIVIVWCEFNAKASAEECFLEYGCCNDLSYEY